MTPSPTIRLFVSSTFSDLKEERNALQEKVFSRLKQLCLAKGLRFQAIDLRWGISDEAGRDNKTMRICLRELKRCQQDRPKPNFLILLGDRYGWRPLPETMPADVFEALERILASENIEHRTPNFQRRTADQNKTVVAESSTELLRTWYRRDDNAVPPEYVLQPREGRFGEFAVWESEVERPLLDALVKAAEAAGIDMGKAGLAIGSSATEQEIVEGALKVADASTHVRAFFRTIDGLPNHAPKDYVETGEAAKRLAELKDRISEHIGKDNVCKYRVPWHGDGIYPDDLKDFCDQAWTQLSAVVEQQIAALTKTPPDEQEEQAHQDFGKERCRHFVGRKESLDRIAEYLRQGTGQSLAVVGPSGSGKSAFIAKCVADLSNSALRTPHSAIVTRYIGATPASSDLIQLLRNIVGEIRKRYPAPVATESESCEEKKSKPNDSEIPYEINPLVNAFHEALQRPTADKPLFLFIDALDQLTASNNAHSLAWLPAKLSDHVCLVVSAALPSVVLTKASDPDSASSVAGGDDPGSSTISDRGYSDPRTAIIAALTARLDSAHRVTLSPLTTADGEQMLTNWLADAQRTLQPEQRKAVLAAFANEGSPLWLRTATEEAARVPYWQSVPPLAFTTQGLLGQVLERLSREEEHGEMLVSRTLSYLACARHGLAEDEILDILSADKEVMDDFRRRSPNSPKVDSLPVAVWVRLHGDLAFYLAEHQAQGASLLGFYHRSFLEAVTARGLVSREDRQARHQHLADWFGKQCWFIAPATEESKAAQGTISDPSNARKASELPWHLYKTADASDPKRCQEPIWQPLTDVLSDLLLVEAKVRAGLVFELQEDYHFALKALPEAQAEAEKERERQERIARWTRELIAYSQAWSAIRDRQSTAGAASLLSSLEPQLPTPPPSCRMWTDEEIKTECQRIIENPTRLDRLTAFTGFVIGQCYPLLEYGGRPGFVLQHAFNAEPAGFVHDTAAVLLPLLHEPYLLRLWHANAFRNTKPILLRILEGHCGDVTGLSVTPDGRRAVSGSSDNTLRVWDLESGVCLRTLEDHSAAVWDVDMTPDGLRAVSGSSDNTLRVWDLESGMCLRTLEGHSDAVWRVSVTPDGRRAVSKSLDNTVRVWDLENGVCLRTLEGFGSAIVCVTPDGRRVVSGGSCNSLRVWELESGDCLHILEGHTDNVRSLCVTPDGHRAVSGSNDNTLRVWDLDSGLCLYTRHSQKGWFNSVSVTSDGRRVVSGSFNNTLQVWELQSGACMRTLEGQNQVIYDLIVRVTSDGRRAIVGGNTTLQVWDLESGASQRTQADHSGGGEMVRVILTPDGQRAVSSGKRDKTLRVWELDSGVCLRTLEGHSAAVWDVDVTPDGRRAVSGSSDNTLRVWDLESGDCLHILKGHSDRVESLSAAFFEQ